MKHTCGKDGDPGAVAPLDGVCLQCEAEKIPCSHPEIRLDVATGVGTCGKCKVVIPQSELNDLFQD